MSSTGPFQSAHELRQIAGKTSGAVLPDEDADTLPIPVKVDGAVVILIMYYRERGRPGQRVVAPPHYAMHLDGRTGRVLKFWAVVPEDLGINDPSAAVEGVGIPPGMSSDDFFQKRERLLAISPDVWAAYARGAAPTDPAVRPLASEYWSLFSQITKREVAPFYLQASPDFFAWIRAATSAAAPGRP
ncbi:MULTISPECIES: hypothetical protein [Sorangium]|uniref:Uncharacterized protein n=1 Tax=Sorangium cellulosum TaxID=56 RepID=A0A4P2QXN8_SORCE|nr:MULTISPECIES: hypothetical protein [Sorangium]AUX35235.1 uncharacterized protein SOCE836_074250 [Sorangium cellulosum]WCQ94540.1 hypothetical protein NQZ70_07308 [Sorangium sp. Soce836]